LVPLVGLGVLQPPEHVLGKQGEFAVVPGIVGRVLPTVRGQMRTDLVLEHRLVMEGHDYTASLTSIFPVTALVIRADRYSRRVSIISVDLAMRESIFKQWSSKNCTMTRCSGNGGRLNLKFRT